MSPAARSRAASAPAARRFAFAIAFALACAGAKAGELWRCGPDGRTFTDRPCADGEPIARVAPPSAQARAEAQAVAQREQLALQHLVAERRAREAAPWAEGRFAPAAIRPLASAEAAARPQREHGTGPRKRRQGAGRSAPDPAALGPARETAPPPAKPRPYAARAPG